MKDNKKREYLAKQSHEQLEIFVMNHELTEDVLRDRLFLLSGCKDFGGQDGMDGSCVDCYHENPSLHERCCLFQNTISAYHKKYNEQQKWCDYHMLDENNSIVCSAHLAEGRALSCPYESNQDRLNSKYPCSDYKPISKS